MVYPLLCVHYFWIASGFFGYLQWRLTYLRGGLMFYLASIEC